MDGSTAKEASEGEEGVEEWTGIRNKGSQVVRADHERYSRSSCSLKRSLPGIKKIVVNSSSSHSPYL